MVLTNQGITEFLKKLFPKRQSIIGLPRCIDYDNLHNIHFHNDFDETKVFSKSRKNKTLYVFAKNICQKTAANEDNGGGDLMLQTDENVADLRNYHFKTLENF